MSAVRNNSTKALLDGPLQGSQAYGEGAFRWVQTGRYTVGARRGQRCVAKWFKTGAVYEDIFFQKDILAVGKAQQIVDAFNAAGIINTTIYLNHPEVWVMSGGPNRGQKILLEPFIEGFQKFNSNSGHVSGSSAWHKAMSALSHFSYHHTGGAFVLCDLQGGLLSGGGVVLTDPVILSRSRAYGAADLGPDGITTFFTRHNCNTFCAGHWTRPRARGTHFRLQASTTMQLPPSYAPAAAAAASFLRVFAEEDEDDDSDDY